ncbi:MAG TPA: DUF4159 domain-containing protein [Phycisphaerae bacterium]|nr:DUF4159 domain-containing protein [Phycisphaerae bacterium]
MTRRSKGAFAAVMAACLLAAAALRAEEPKPAPAPKPITDVEVSRAIELGRQYLVRQAKPDGSFATGNMAGGLSALTFMTLAYMGEHPNREHMDKGLTYLMDLGADVSFHDRQGYAVPIRVMGLSYVYKKLLGGGRRFVQMKAKEDIMRMQMGQATGGGWRYKLAGGNEYDFSVTQWPILAMRDAERAGIEFPDPTKHLQKALDLYLRHQHEEGGWYYQGKAKGTGSMTAAGLASLFIIADFLEPGSGCPCSRTGTSPRTATKTERAMDAALGWLSKHFDAKKNPEADGRTGAGNRLYWLYCVERVGIAAGYKYFGTHDWYKEGVAEIIRQQGKNGSWGQLDNTCFALLFLYKGRAPILFNKLKFGDDKTVWNAHRRDIANLTHYIEQTKEQMFHWQIVELKAPLEELHDAPILFITPETVPEFPPEQMKKLRDFTDTGGTILFEASCGNPPVRKWFIDFVARVWPEWKIARLGKDHGVWGAFNKMKARPEILGVSDGVRTSVFYSPDDISCAWQTRAFTQKMYLFNWGINLYTYATDGAPLRAKLAGREPPKSDRYAGPVKAGPRKTVTIARVKYGGNWEAGANYRGFAGIAKHVKAKADITLDVREPKEAPFTDGGTEIKDLAAGQVAYLAGSQDFALTADEKKGLKKYLDDGGFLLIESVTGALAFDQAVRKLATEMGWQLKLLAGTHPLLHGRMDGGAEGYNLTAGVEYRKALRQDGMLGRRPPRFDGIYVGDKLVGLYSPVDMVFSTTDYEAHLCRGYKTEDAIAVATNLVLYLSTLK